MSVEDEIRDLRRELHEEDGSSPDWSPLQWSTTLQIQLGQAAHAAAVLEGMDDPTMPVEFTPAVYRRALKSIAAASMDAIERFDERPAT